MTVSPFFPETSSFPMVEPAFITVSLFGGCQQIENSEPLCHAGNLIPPMKASLIPTAATELNIDSEQPDKNKTFQSLAYLILIHVLCHRHSDCIDNQISLYYILTQLQRPFRNGFTRTLGEIEKKREARKWIHFGPDPLVNLLRH